jgi:hypothetical protein
MITPCLLDSQINQTAGGYTGATVIIKSDIAAGEETGGPVSWISFRRRELIFRQEKGQRQP